MRHGRAVGIAAMFALLIAGGTAPSVANAAGTAPAGAGGIAADIDNALQDARLTGAHAGVVVRDAETGTVLYGKDQAGNFNPASNEKLLVSTAALDILGTGYRFTTSVVNSGNRSGNTLNGNLFLKGTGDPTVTAAGYDDLAAKVAAAGIRTVNGALITDDTWFDDVRLGTEWAWDDEQYMYAMQTSALTVAGSADFDAGVVNVRWAPGAAAGAAAVVTLDPPTSYLSVQNEATTVAGSGRNITVTRRHGTNTIVVSGTIGAGAAAGSNYRTVDEPTLYAASIFRAALARHGVTISKPTTLTGSAPTSAATVTSRDSMTLEQLLPYFLKLSNNGHAELLVKAMGRKASNTGTAAAGIAAIRSFLARTGVEPAKVRLADGAGLSRQDLVSPEQVTALLVGARSKPWFTTWYNALPIAGNSDKMIGGTLASRMGGTAAANNVHGKTGTLTGVSALSGFVTTAGGQKLVFSILLNQFLGDSAPKSIEDTIAVALANSGGAAAATHRDLARLKAPRAIKDDPSTPVDERALECSWLKSC